MGLVVQRAGNGRPREAENAGQGPSGQVYLTSSYALTRDLRRSPLKRDPDSH